MLRTILKDWPGQVEVDSQHYTSINEFLAAFKELSDDTHIKLLAKRENANSNVFIEQKQANDKQVYVVSVKKYMTEPASPGFDFMAKWNNNKPMPMRTMVGTIEKETKGMVYMKLRGMAFPVVRCMRCGRLLTNPISQHYGIGPECITKLGFVCDVEDVDAVKLGLQEIRWEGWIIKSAITEKEIFEN